MNQRTFYDRFYADEKSHNRAARLWLTARRRLKGSGNPVQEIIVRRVREECEAARGGTVLKVGCDRQTEPTFHLTEIAAHVHVIDLAQSGVDRLAHRLTERGASNFTAEAKDFMLLPEKPTYDLIYMPGVFHHLPSAPEGIRKIGALLQPGGKAVLTEPLNNNVVVRFARGVVNLARNNADWERPLTLSEWRRYAATFPVSVIELYEGFTPLAWILPGRLKARAVRRLYAIERRLLKKRRLERLYLNALIVLWQGRN